MPPPCFRLIIVSYYLVTLKFSSFFTYSFSDKEREMCAMYAAINCGFSRRENRKSGEVIIRDAGFRLMPNGQLIPCARGINVQNWWPAPDIPVRSVLRNCPLRSLLRFPPSTTTTLTIETREGARGKYVSANYAEKGPVKMADAGSRSYSR